MEWYSNRKLWALCQLGNVKEIKRALDDLPTDMLQRDDDFYGEDLTNQR